MTLRRPLPILLAFALLLSQAAASTHALTHVGGDAKAPAGHVSLCAKCASFDKLSLIEPTIPPVNLRSEASSPRVVVAAASFTPRTAVPFQSRAPPSAL